MSDSGSGSEDEGSVPEAPQIDRRACLDVAKTKNIVEGTDQWECRGCKQVFTKKKAARQHRYRVNAWLRKNGLPGAEGEDGGDGEGEDATGGKKLGKGGKQEKKRKAREAEAEAEADADEDDEGSDGDEAPQAVAAGGSGDSDEDSDAEEAAAEDKPPEKRKRGPTRGKRGGARHRKSEEVCRAFLQGTCGRGEKCKFQHTKAKAEPSLGGAGSKWGTGKKEKKKEKKTKEGAGGGKKGDGGKAKPDWGAERPKKFKKSKA